MYKPDGLLTILRLAIVNNKSNQAAQIARLCAECRSIYFRKFCRFIGRILLEDKFPDGRKYFKELNNLMDHNLNKNLQNAQQKYVEIAYSAAKIKTNSKPFEEAFIALHEFVYEDNFWIGEMKNIPSSNENIQSFILQEKRRDNDLKILRKELTVVKNAVLRNYDDDKTNNRGKSHIFLNYEEIPADSTTTKFSNDHVLTCMYESLQPNKQYNEMFTRNWQKDYIRTHDIKKMLNKQIQDGELIFNTTIFGKRKRDYSTEEVFNYLYPKATKDGAFKQAMKQYLASNGPKHYTSTNCLPPLQHLRQLARYKISRWRKVINVNNVNYGISYISFNDESWTVQLLAPSNAEKNDTIRSYPLTGTMFKVRYPTHEAPDLIHHNCEIPDAEHCKEVIQFTKSRTDGELKYFYKFEQDVGTKVNFSAKFLTCDDICCSFMKMLVFRYYKRYRTTLKDIQFREHGESYILYSFNNNNLKSPNMKHPDIWHQLLYYQDLRDRQKNQSTIEIHKNWSKKKRSPILNIIDRLQQFLSNKGYKIQSTGEYSPFFLWLKNNFKDQNYTSKNGLWHRLIASLDVKNRKWNLVSRHVEYINDEFNRENV